MSHLGCPSSVLPRVGSQLACSPLNLWPVALALFGRGAVLSDIGLEVDVMAVRVLQALASLDQGGAETVVMAWLRAMDRERIAFDFVVNERERPYDYEEEVRRLGGRIFRLPRLTPLNVGAYALRWWRLLKEHPEWRVIHAHHTTAAPVYLSVAKVLGRTVWSHSHSAGVEQSPKGLVKKVSHILLPPLSDRMLSCSALAAKSVFRRAASRAVVLPNAIEVAAFGFSRQDRERVREEFALSTSAFVVGHVGRFADMKNHRFLVDAFSHLACMDPDSRLLLVGKGALEPAVRRQVAELGLFDRVVFAGARTDVAACLAAMDVLVMPSLYEGFPVSLVEAQANGLQVLVSDSVTLEAAITPHVEYLPLSLGSATWAQRIAAQRWTSGWDRQMCADQVRTAGFDTSTAVARLAAMYEEAVEATGSKGSRG